MIWAACIILFLIGAILFFLCTGVYNGFRECLISGGVGIAFMIAAFSLFAYNINCWSAEAMEKRRQERLNVYNSHFYTVTACDGKVYNKLRLWEIDEGVAIMFSTTDKKYLFKNYTIVEE